MMRDSRCNILSACIVGVAAAALWLLPAGAIAAESPAAWRPIYDLVLRYINFFILVFLILKYARKPLVTFFKDKSQDIKTEIRQIEAAKDQVQQEVKSLLEEQEKTRERFEQIKERIISQGQIKKKNIIEDARQESKLLLQNTQLKIDARLLKARLSLRSEMIDMAVDLAMKQLPQQITAQDNQRFLEKYLEGANAIVSTSLAE